MALVSTFQRFSDSQFHQHT